jgi:hypothetical protein
MPNTVKLGDSRGVRAASVTAALLLTACNIDPFLLGVSRDGGFEDAKALDGDSGMNNRDGGTPDANGTGGTDACVAAIEVCDGIDNDCDSRIDEGFNTQIDPGNCGGCGITCFRPGAAGTCTAGICSFSCLPGFHDLDTPPDLDNPNGDGCEYGPCIIQGAEVCNGIDDDCDRNVDEEIPNLDSDPLNCGRCFKICTAANAEPVCVGGTCSYDPTTCDPDFADVNPNINGCEYPCPDPSRPAEVCDAIDNDCDGLVNEIEDLADQGFGGDCDDSPEQRGDVGECSFGVLECRFGVPVCVGYDGPETERCDDLDHDCDGDPRNGFDTDNDPNNCGLSCTRCNLPNAVNSCQGGSCAVGSCLFGFEDADGVASNGCEYPCVKTGNEVCDGKDNDCDTRVDEELTPPPLLVCNETGLCGAAGNGGNGGGGPECVACRGVFQWMCVYTDPAVETNSCGGLVFQESLCDLQDNDCDGKTDESYPQVGQACDDGGIGKCKGTGTFICDLNADPKTAVTCNITSGPFPADPVESCNLIDDDCDTRVDEEMVDSMVLVTDSSGTIPSFFIDAFEASRPDADLDDPGVSNSYACSNPGALPWRNLTRPEAEAACAARGKRLCREEEWQHACEAGVGNKFPYGNTYDPLACNGADYDFDCTPPNNNETVLPTGFDYGCPPVADSCTADWGAAGLVYDLSGNVKEWTGDETFTGSGLYRVRGGSFQNVSISLTCQHSFIEFDDTVRLPSIGFRCCQDAL